MKTFIDRAVVMLESGVDKAVIEAALEGYIRNWKDSTDKKLISFYDYLGITKEEYDSLYLKQADVFQLVSKYANQK